jgi:hypothetical protein
MEVPLGTVFSMLSMLIAMSCNKREIVGSSVLCGSIQGLYLENQNTAESAESSDSAVNSSETDPVTPSECMQVTA